MNYNLDKFIRPLLETDKIVTIFNNLGKPTYTINPTAVARVYISSNLLKINLTKNNTVIILDFSDNSEAKQALLRLQSQFNLIKNRLIADDKAKETAISQVQDSLDFSGLYQNIISGSTYSYSGGTSSGTASTIESRLFSLVQKIGTDVVNINDKVAKKITTTYNPINTFSDEVDEYYDILGVEFDYDSLGDVNIYINSVLVLAQDNQNGIAYFGNETTIKNTIFIGSKLFMNPYLLGYIIDPSDNISIESLKQCRLSDPTTTTTTTSPTTTTSTTEEQTTTTTSTTEEQTTTTSTTVGLSPTFVTSMGVGKSVNISSQTTTEYWKAIHDGTTYGPYSGTSAIEVTNSNGEFILQSCDSDGSVNGDITNLVLPSNQLTSFNGTELESLIYLDLNDNKLTSFDGTGLSSLTELYLGDNQLTEFDVTELSSLTQLYLGGNQLTEFDGTGLVSLTTLSLNNNQFSSFNGSGLSVLTYLRLDSNQLTSFSGNDLTNLTELYLFDNKLTSLDVSSLVNLYLLKLHLEEEDGQLTLTNPMTPTSNDVILSQLANHSVDNGQFISSGGRTSASTSDYETLVGRGWNLSGIDLSEETTTTSTTEVNIGFIFDIIRKVEFREINSKIGGWDYSIYVNLLDSQLRDIYPQVSEWGFAVVDENLQISNYHTFYQTVGELARVTMSISDVQGDFRFALIGKFSDDNMVISEIYTTIFNESVTTTTTLPPDTLQFTSNLIGNAPTGIYRNLYTSYAEDFYSDTIGVGAEFCVVMINDIEHGISYNITCTKGGFDYSVGDRLVIYGSLYGGDGSIEITITNVPTTNTLDRVPDGIYENIVTDSLQLHFDINSPDCYAGGFTLNDLSSNAYVGNIFNAIFDSDGNGSLSFDGSDDYVSTNFSMPVIGSDTDFTWDFWIKANDSGAWSIVGNRGGNDLIKFIKIHQFGFQFYPTSGDNGDIYNQLPIGQWVNVCITKSGTTIKYYMNNSLVGTKFNVGDMSLTNEFYLGGDPTANEYSNSKVSIIRVYNKALSLEEMNLNYTVSSVRFS